MPKLIFHIGLRIAMAVIVIAMLLMGLPSDNTQPSSDSADTSKLRVQDTTNLDLQWVRLLAQTDGNWTPTTRQELRQIHQQRGDGVVAAAFVPPQAETRLSIVQADIQNNNISDAISTLDRLLSEDPEQPQANFWRGVLALPNLDAETYLTPIASGESMYQALAARILGIIAVEGYTLRDVALPLLESGEWQLADYLLSRHISEENLDALAYAYRGYVRDQSGLDGLQDIQTALSLDPALPTGFFMLGLHYRQNEIYDRSLQAFVDAFLLDNTNPALAAELATAYHLVNDSEQAIEWYVLAAEISEGDVRFVALAAAYYADEGYLITPEEAGYQFVESAAAVFPNNVSILTSWARILMLNNLNAPQAENIFNQALALNPNNPRLLYYLAEYQEQRGLLDEALTTYGRIVLTDNPFTDRAQQGILRLSQ